MQIYTYTTLNWPAIAESGRLNRMLKTAREIKSWDIGDPLQISTRPRELDKTPLPKQRSGISLLNLIRIPHKNLVCAIPFF
jgi:hypothetical protein